MCKFVHIDRNRKQKVKNNGCICRNVSESAKTFGAALSPMSHTSNTGLVVFCLNYSCRACKRLEPSKHTKFLRYKAQTLIFWCENLSPKMQYKKLLFGLVCTFGMHFGSLWHIIITRTRTYSTILDDLYFFTVVDKGCCMIKIVNAQEKFTH